MDMEIQDKKNDILKRLNGELASILADHTGGILSDTHAKAIAKILLDMILYVEDEKNSQQDRDDIEERLNYWLTKLGLPLDFYLLKTELHRQPRTYLRNAAWLVGRDTEPGRDLLTLPGFDDVIEARKALSRLAAITGNLLLKLWQQNKNAKGFYVIKNLTEIASMLNITPQDLKIYLLYLGGYQYPVIRYNKKTHMLTTYSDKIFMIKFNHRLKDGEDETVFTKDDKVGTNYLSFIKNRDIDSVEVKPSTSLIEDTECKGKGKSLGYILADADLIPYCLNLNDLEYKIFCYSAANRPKNYEIGFNRLIEHLNLKKQVKGQGKPRILNWIKRALQGLKDKGHLTSYYYDEAKDKFSWTYTGKIFKHKDLLPLKTVSPAISQENGKTGDQV